MTVTTTTTTEVQIQSLTFVGGTADEGGKTS
jgi:hypothetical protein